MATLILRPSGAGTYTQFNVQYPDSGAHWDKVDEETADDAATYIRNTVAAFKTDTFALPDHGSASGTINKVTVFVRWRCDYYAASNHYVYVRTYDTDYNQIRTANAGGAWNLISAEWTTNPNTSSAWTWTEIDALEAGVGMYNYNTCADCTQVYVEVDYIAVTPKTSSDTGSGVDAYVSLVIVEAKSSSDAGSGLEGTPLPGASLAGNETGSGIEVLAARLLASFDTGSGVEVGGLLKSLFVTELGEGLDLLTAKIEMPTKGGGMKLWT